jgi:hypothetical protein
MYDMDVGCSLKGSTPSTIVSWDHFHIYIIYYFRELSQIWGNLCGGNGMNVLPYPHPQLFNRNTTIRVRAGTKISRPVGFLL